MQYDSEGFLYPAVDEALCVKCGLCEQRCPANTEQTNFSEYLKTYAGYTTNQEVLQSTASGGFATELSKMVVEEGGLVAGVVYAQDHVKSCYGLASNAEQLNAFRSSKYVQSEKGDIYAQVKEQLQNGKQVLFIGCPCDVAALYSVLKGIETQKLLTCELVCMGVTSYKIAEAYKAYAEKKYKKQIVHLDARSKHKGWFVPHLEVAFSDGSVRHQPLYSSYYGRGFQIYNRPSCFHCTYRGTNGYADIRIGDFWGIKESDSFWNKDGVSCIFVRTPKGQQAVEKLREREFALFETTYAYATDNNMSSTKNKKESYFLLREKFAKEFLENGLVAACNKTADLSYRLKRIIPANFHSAAKKVYHFLRDKR